MSLYTNIEGDIGTCVCSFLTTHFYFNDAIVNSHRTYIHLAFAGVVACLSVEEMRQVESSYLRIYRLYFLNLKM
jgi:hypothetical protein